MSDDDVLEQSSRDESSSVDIVELLAAANSRVFDDQNSLTDTNKSFEKVSSFFDLIKSSNNEDANLAEQDQSPESPAEGSLDEEVVGLKISSLDGVSDDNEINEEIVGLKVSSRDGASDDKEIDEEIVGLKISSRDDASGDMQTERGINDPEVENSNFPGDEEVPQENFEPLDVIEKSRETVEKLKSQDEADADQVDETSEEYNRGYQDALIEFEKTLDAEKKAISSFGTTLLSIRDDSSKIIEELIKEKISAISNEFLGKQVSDFPEDFLTHIENISSSIVSSTSEIIVELNEIDAAALKTNIKLDQLAFKIREVTDLGRAEFRIIMGKSGYEQKIAD
jgi:hypothetical protein